MRFDNIFISLICLVILICCSGKEISEQQMLLLCDGNKVKPCKKMLENKEKCFLVNPNPMENESVSWNGKCKSGYVNGKGHMEWKVDGERVLTVDGQWEKGILNGETRMHFKSGTYYEGTIVNNLENGYGIKKYSDGSVYKGSWKDGKRNGNGLYIHSNGTQFKGNYIKDYENGIGKIIWTNGATFEGNFKNGKQIKGTTTYPEDFTTSGDYENSKLSGQGTFSVKEIGEIKCIWKDGEIIKVIDDKKTKEILPLMRQWLYNNFNTIKSLEEAESPQNISEASRTLKSLEKIIKKEKIKLTVP